jgi:ABC-type methionine transport system permease subunit
VAKPVCGSNQSLYEGSEIQPYLLPLAVILVTSANGGIHQAPALNRALGAFVNLFRSIPFLILMVALIPFTL